MNSFLDRLRNRFRSSHSLVCVGLDPDPQLMPVPDVLEFNKAIVDATRDFVCAYKPNLSFYEAEGIEGLRALEGTINYIRTTTPLAIIIGDGKRGDVASTNAKYARALFEVLGFDAVTVNGYAGGESLEPFFEYEDRGVFVWCRSSNTGAREFQDLGLLGETGPMPLYEMLAERAYQWNSRDNVGLVVGATYPQEMAVVRSHCPGMPILVPGVGAQGGDLEACVKMGVEKDGLNVLISASRSIIYASRHRRSFAKSAGEAAQDLRERINGVLSEEGIVW